MDWDLLRQQYDKKDYYSDLIAFPDYIERALEQLDSFEFHVHPKSIVVAGMGGSAVPGYLLKDYCYSKLDVPVEVIDFYDLPAWVNKDTLVFIISYSGNTEEALSCLRQAMERNAKIVCIASGGLLKQAASKYGYFFIQAPKKLQPRAAVPYLITYVLEVLRKNELLLPKYLEAIKECRKLKLGINEGKGVKKIAELMMGRMVYVYIPYHLRGVGRMIQSQCFNENAKTLAKLSVLPEANHSETTAVSEMQDLPLASLFCWDDQMSKSLKERMKFSRDLAKQKGEVFTIKARGNGLLSRMLTLIYQGAMLSYYLSLLRHKDPLPVRVVEKLKAHLVKKTNIKKNLLKRLGLE